MGFGNYMQIIYGIPDRAVFNADAEVWDAIEDVAGDEGIYVVSSYEGATSYWGVRVARNMGNDWEINLGTCRLAEIHGRLLKQLDPKTATVEAQWKRLQEIAAKHGVTLPDGELLWVEDYD